MEPRTYSREDVIDLANEIFEWSEYLAAKREEGYDDEALYDMALEEAEEALMNEGRVFEEDLQGAAR